MDSLCVLIEMIFTKHVFIAIHGFISCERKYYYQSVDGDYQSIVDDGK